jgi:serine/threonine-protein kinase
MNREKAGGAFAVTDLFVSYKAEDRARVAPLVHALEADGYKVWWDAEIGGGEQWREEICRHLDAARLVIVVWSKRSIGPQGNFVRDEATRALKRHAYLPVTIDKVEPPLGFGETQSLNLQSWKGDPSHHRYQALLAAVRSRIGRSDPAGAPVAKRGLDRRTAMVGGAGAVAAAAVGGWLLLRPRSAKADSIAVLPFANLSGDAAQTYFSDGIAEELRSALARIPGLKVVARTSSEAVRDEDAATAASKLKVSNILSGSVRRSFQTLRVTAQLIDGRDGTERWSEVYDRSAGDALQIQTDIANKVAEALSIRLGGADRQHIAQGGTSKPEAQDLLLQAEAYTLRNTGREAWERGISMIDQALAIDPNYGNALAGKAMMLKVLAGAYAPSAAQSQREYRDAESVARRAVAAAPESPRGYSVLGDILYEQLHPRAAVVQYRKMLSLNVDDVAAYRGYSIFLGENKRTDEALQLINRALALDPLNAHTLRWKGYILAAARRYEEAIAAVQEASRISPERTQSGPRIGYYLTMLGRYDEAAKAMKEGTENSPVIQVYRAALAVRTGRREEAEAVLGEFQGSDFANFQKAEVLAQLGRKDEAIATLNEAYVKRDSGLTTILVDPLLDPLRNDPRFDAIVKRIDFPA